MNSSDPDDSGNEPAPDPCLRAGVRSLPIPDTPSALESRVRQCIRHRRIQRGVLASGSVLALIIAVLLVWQPWGAEPTPVAHKPPAPQPVPPREISPEQLDVLFAPPPVDRLSILDRQDRGFVTVLHRLEDRK
jgi:hypothetical protein